ncbi:MAG: SWIM zinc finger family protein [Terricaulis sp.]
MARADLVALTDDALVQLSNAGLVKRGLRDLADGASLTLNETEDGAIEARVADGTLTRLAPGKAPGDADCTCPASGMCRHRVALVLAYRHAHGGTQGASTEPWDPGALERSTLEAALSAQTRAELARLRTAPLTVRLSRSVPPSAALPMASVRFLAPNDAAYARCDCVAGQGCAHIVLAIEAFRLSGGANEVTLGASAPPVPAAGLTELCDAVLLRLLEEGATAGLAAHGAIVDRARKQAELKGATWLVLALEAFAAQIAAYEQRSALYDEFEVLALAVELYARPRANSTSAMGFGEAMETTMAKTRLASLGARITTRGRDVNAIVALYDTDTGATMLVEKLLSPAPSGERPSHDAVLSRQLASGLSLKGLARGQVVTSVAHRRADGTVRFGSGARGKSSLMGRGVLADARPPLLVTQLETLRAQLAAEPPSFLAPRNRVQHFHVFEIAEVVGQMFDPGAQMWRAAVTLANDGGRLNLQRRYDAGAPSALDVLGATFSAQHGALRQLAGQVRIDGGEIVCDPWSASADAFIVPDCDSGGESLTPLSAPLVEETGAPANARVFLAGALHAGARRRDDAFKHRGRKLTGALETAGYAGAADRMNIWLTQGDVQAFGRLAVWLAALAEH